MAIDYGRAEYGGFVLNVRGTPAGGWLVSVSRTGFLPKEFSASADEGMDDAIDKAKRWIDEQAARSKGRLR